MTLSLLSELDEPECDMLREPIVSNAERVRFIRHAFSLNNKQMADVLRVSRPTVYSWMNGETSIHSAGQQRVNMIYELARQ